MKIFLVHLFLITMISLLNCTYGQESGNDAFGAVSIKLTKMLGKSETLLGGRFGWVIDNQFVLGGGVYALVGGINTNFNDPNFSEGIQVNFNYGGLQLEYILLAKYNVHASFDILIAGAGLYYSYQNKPNSAFSSQSFTIYEPELNLEFNLLTWLHLDASCSYKLVTGLDNYGNITPNDVRGISGVLTFKFGSY